MEITKARIIGTIAIFILIGLFIFRPVPDKNQILATDAMVTEVGLFDHANDERETRMKWDDCLAGQARERAKFLFDNENRAGYFAHYTPDGTTPWQFVEKCGYRYAGENLIKGFDNFGQMHEALMKSELHRKNIINTRYNAMGTGCYGNICVEFFKD